MKNIAILLISILLIVAIGLGAIYWQWWNAGQQAEVWRSQGVEITQWQVFIGIQPAAQVRRKP